MTPGKELGPEEQYEIDLVILVSPDKQADLDAIKIEAETLARQVAKDRIAMVSAPCVEPRSKAGIVPRTIDCPSVEAKMLLT